MNRAQSFTNPARALLIVLAGLFAGALPADGEPRLRVTQSYADSPERGPLLSPTGQEPVSFILEVDFACRDDETLAGLFLSIADTAITADAAVSPQAVLIKISPAQLKSLHKTARCEAAGPRRLRQQITAFGTVSCSNESGRTRAQTVSTPLDIWYDCPGSAEPERSAPEDLSDELNPGS